MSAEPAVEETIGGSAVAFRRLDPRIRTAWWITGVLSALPWIAIAIVMDRVLDLPGPGGALPVAVGIAAVGLAVVVPLVRYRRWAYALRQEDLWIRRGVLQVTVTVIPLRRLQFVDTRQGVLERMLGLAELVVHTASPGTSGRLVGIPLAEAERLRDRLGATIADDGVV